MYGWFGTRFDLLERLIGLPEGVFVSFEDFERYIKETAFGFVKINLDSCMPTAYDGARVANTWQNRESRILRVFLCCFCALGMVDLAFRECDRNSKEDSDAMIKELKISALSYK
jgi:hypothetical protein